MTHENLLDLKDIRVSLGSRNVLERSAMTVAKGEVAAVIGRNGAGKTVLLNAVAGFVPLASGQVILDGVDISRLRPEHRVKLGLSLVSQHRHIFTSLTVEENLRLGAFPLRGERGSFMDVFNWILEVFPGVGSHLDQRAATLSRGESTLLAIARGLMCGPKVMLIDEPFGGLSREAIEDLASTLRMIARKGTTVVFTEQQGERAALVTERALLLQPGGQLT